MPVAGSVNIVIPIGDVVVGPATPPVTHQEVSESKTILEPWILKVSDPVPFPPVAGVVPEAGT